MNDIAGYLAKIELALVSSPIIATYQVIRSWANTDDGYIRVRATVTNGDFLEAAEYFILQENHIVTVDYRHQWMDGEKNVLQQRWDSTPDHPELENFPHHVHTGSEEAVVPGHPICVIDLLALLKRELSQT